MSTGQLDTTDERNSHDSSPAGRLRAALRDIRSGDLGALPVVVGLIVIAIIFQSLNPVFLSSGNLVNLLLDSAPVGVISLGIVFVLIVGEIDLSVGSVSGLTAAVVAVLFVRHEWNWVLAVALALGIALLIGLTYGLALTRFGMPSFVASLAGLLAFLGVQLALLGGQGSINLPFDSVLVTFAQVAFVPAWLSYILAALAPAGMFAAGYEAAIRRRRANLSSTSLRLLLARELTLVVALEFGAWYLNRERGVGWSRRWMPRSRWRWSG